MRATARRPLHRTVSDNRFVQKVMQVAKQPGSPGSSALGHDAILNNY